MTAADAVEIAEKCTTIGVIEDDADCLAVVLQSVLNARAVESGIENSLKRPIDKAVVVGRVFLAARDGCKVGNESGEVGSWVARQAGLYEFIA